MMQDRQFTHRQDTSLMPWTIAASGDLQRPCILVAKMDGNEMVTISLHVIDPPSAEYDSR